jgi:hypothetical protein
MLQGETPIPPPADTLESIGEAIAEALAAGQSSEVLPLLARLVSVLKARSRDSGSCDSVSDWARDLDRRLRKFENPGGR